VRRLNVRQHIVILSALLVGLWGLAPQAAQAAPPVCTGSCLALINGDTVTGSPSVEQTLATAAGFTVTVVSGPVWDTMMAADFAAYRVLIAGDPTCKSLATSFTSNSSTWAPVVMGTSVNTAPGNRILIGTDPVFHRLAHPGADILIQDGIAFAGTLPGRTGLYFDDSCGMTSSKAATLSTLAKLSAGSGTWTENASPPCGVSVSLIASNPAFSDLTSADLQGWNCSDHETFPTFPDDWNALAVATDTPTKPTCGSDPGGPIGNTVCGEAYILLSGIGTVVIAPNITLTPADATDPVGGTHTVTACLFTGVSCGLSPTVGQLVVFTITGQNAGVSGICAPVTCTTDAIGMVTFTYPDTNGAGDDTIIASFTAGNPPSKQQASAIKHWKTTNASPTITTSASPTVSQVVGTTFAVSDIATFQGTTSTAPTGSVSFTLFNSDCSVSTVVSGSVSISTSGGVSTASFSGSFTPTAPGTYQWIASYGGDPNNNAFKTKCGDSGEQLTVINASPTITTSATKVAVVGGTVLDKATLSGGTATMGGAITFNLFGPNNPGCTLLAFTSTTTVSGNGTYSSAPFTPLLPGTYLWVASYSGDTNNNSASTVCGDTGETSAVFSFAPGGGSFVIGDNNAAVGSSVTFWGAQWARDNSLSGGKAPNSFKGFAENPTTPTCGAVWSADPGNSTPPPAGPLPDFMAVIVTSSADKSGSTISGNIVHIVIVKTNPGYEPNPGHAGTGTVVAVVC
jgi:hypothetical protein